MPRRYLPCTGTLFLTLLVGAVLASDQPPGDPGKSTDLSPAAASISFTNNSGAAVDLVWVDRAGVEKPFGVLAPGQTRPIQTFHGHLWRFKQNSQTIGFYQANQPGSQSYAIRRVSGAADNKQQMAGGAGATDPGKTVNISSTNVMVAFLNNSSDAVELVWVDYAGVEKPFAKIERGAFRAQQTLHGHLWRFKQNGSVIGFYLATNDASQFTYVGKPPLLMSTVAPTASDSTKSVDLSTTSVNMTLQNNTEAAVDVFWVDRAGVENPWGTLQRGSARPQQTIHGHLWRFKQDGRVIGTYQATQAASQTYQIGKAQGPARPEDYRTP
jgi:hypothetical protein